MRNESNRPASILRQEKKGKRVNAWVDVYTHWVIENLVGTMGRNPTDVATTIIHEWMVANRPVLETLKLWPPEIEAGKVKIIPPGA